MSNDIFYSYARPSDNLAHVLAQQAKLVSGYVNIPSTKNSFPTNGFQPYMPSGKKHIPPPHNY